MRIAERLRPGQRRLRVFALDPSLDRTLATAEYSRLVLKVPWDGSRPDDPARGPEPGPVGEYLEVLDIDPASGCWYEPVDLNEPVLLAQDGLAPSTANPQFHQQMVYAVAMATIGHFERALGRRILWAERPHDQVANEVGRYVQRLRLYPHAFRGENAYYSPEKKALLFGYFPSTATAEQGFQPGGIVFTCLSHDIIAHECTHAVLDGMHGRYLEASNPDVLAFHEAFADLVALFQRFSWPEVLRAQLDRTGGDLRHESLLGELAQEFGRATGSYGALRDALGQRNPDTGAWEPRRPNPAALADTTEPHERGALLVAAVFDAYLTLYRARVADLFAAVRQLRSNADTPLPLELRARLTNDAAAAARHVLTMCIRAIDYCPPVDITFGDFLRALITADFELVPDDDRSYRAAFIEAFTRHGIFPHDVRSMSEEDLLWQPPDADLGPLCEFDGELAEQLRRFVDDWSVKGDRFHVYQAARSCRAALHKALEEPLRNPEVAQALGLNLALPDARYEVHSLRPARRIGPDGQTLVDIVVEITQQRTLVPSQPGAAEFTFRGGSTLVLELGRRSSGAPAADAPEPLVRARYCIMKSIDSERRQQLQAAQQSGRPGVSALVSGVGLRGDEPLALAHVDDEKGEW